MAAFVPLTNAIPRRWCGDKIQPIEAGMGGGTGEDLDEVAVLQRGCQRTEPIIDPRSMAVVPHLGVNPIGEIHRRCPIAQAHHIAVGGEHKHLLVEEVLLDRGEVVVVVVVTPLLLPVHQLPQPVEPVGIAAAARG